MNEENLSAGSLRPGQSVRITGGPFERFIAVANSVDKEKQMIHASVFVFGCETPIQVTPEQIEILSDNSS